MAERLGQTPLTKKTACRLVYEKPGQAILAKHDIAALKPGQILLKSLYSGISRGTESLVFNGKIPKSAWHTMACPNQIGSFGFPLSYGYQLVAKPIAIDENVTDITLNDTFFLLHPHQSLVVIDHQNLNKIPKNVPPRRAVLAANMETALNALWDSDLKSGESVAVLGAGVVGLLIASLCQKETGTPVRLIDRDIKKREVSEKLGLTLHHPDEVTGSFNVVFNATASPAALQFAIDHAAFEATILEVSWYGDKKVSLNLGDRFHSNRLKILSSQVGHVSPKKRAHLDHKGRMQLALKELAHEKYDCLLEQDINFPDIPDDLARIFDPENPVLCQVIRYPD